jgi:hypothetical protein
MATPLRVSPHPSVPIPYAAGVVELLGGVVENLLQLIWEQINRDVPGTSVELRVMAAPTNLAPVFIGAAMSKPLQKFGAQSIWDDGLSIWDNGESQWDQQFTPANDPNPGKLSPKTFGSQITPLGEPRVYRSTYPGGSNGIGNLQVFSEPPAKLHVEIYE